MLLLDLNLCKILHYHLKHPLNAIIVWFRDITKNTATRAVLIVTSLYDFKYFKENEDNVNRFLIF